MSFKKMGLWKLLTVSTVTVCFASILAATPIVTTGYLMGNNSGDDGTSGPTDNGSDNNIGDTNDPTDNGPGDNTGGTGDSTGGEDPNVKKIVLNEKTKTNPLHIVGSFKRLVSSNENQTKLNKELLDKNISNIIKNDSKYMEELIQNYNDVKDAIESISITSSNDNKEQWTGEKTWGEGNPNSIAEIGYYNIKDKQLNVSSIGDLKSQLSINLQSIMTNALQNKDSNYSSYELDSNSALLIDQNGDYLRIHVKATPTTTQSRTASSSDGKTSIELRIPTSDIAYNPNDVKVSITTKENSDIQSLEHQSTYIKYDIGIDPTTHITPNSSDPSKFQEHPISGNETILKVDLSTENSNIRESHGKEFGTVTPMGLAKSLGWYVEPQSNERRSIGELTLNNDKIAQDLQIFNTNFSNLNVESLDKDENNEPIVPWDYRYTGKYKITIDATPTNGHYWETGDNTKKTITLTNNANTKNNNDVFFINISDAAYIDKDLEMNGAKFDDTNYDKIKRPAGVDKNNHDKFREFFEKQENINSLNEALNIELQKSRKLSVGVVAYFDTSYNKDNFINGINEKRIRIVIKAAEGHILKNNISSIGKNLWIESWEKV